MITYKNKENTIVHSVEGDSLNLEPMTTLERDDLIGVLIGTLINNTTTNRIQRWNGVVWEDLNGTTPGGLSYQGLWDANTNTPTIPAADPANNGYYYKVSVAGTTSIDGIATWNVGDWIISNGVTWDRIEQADSVTSVNGDGGVVTVDLQSALDAGNTANRDMQLDNLSMRAIIGLDSLGEGGVFDFTAKDLGGFGGEGQVAISAEEGVTLKHKGFVVNVDGTLGSNQLSMNYSGITNSVRGANLSINRVQNWPDNNGTLMLSVNGILADPQGNVEVTTNLVNYSTVPVLTGRLWIDGKDVYEIVLTAVHSGPDTNKLEIPIVLNVDTTIRAHARQLVSLGTSYELFTYINSTGANVFTLSDSGQLISDGDQIHIIIEYTVI